MKHDTDTPPPQRPSIHLNWQDWLPYLEDANATETEKRQTIEAVWNIALAFVDLGWDIDTSEENWGQSFDLTAALRAAVVNSDEQVLPANDTEADKKSTEAV